MTGRAAIIIIINTYVAIKIGIILSIRDMAAPNPAHLPTRPRLCQESSASFADLYETV
jgi:hypothetical protein